MTEPPHETTIDPEDESVTLPASTDTLIPDDEDRHVAVVGAGAVGATAAYDLARRGAEVTLYERETVAAGASGRAAGICYNAFADELATEIAGESIERLRRLAGEETFPFVECPYVWLARDGDDDRAEVIEDGVEAMQTQGTVALTMDSEALGERFPHLAVDDVAIGAVAGAAGYTDPARYTACMAAAATGVGATLAPETAVSLRMDPPRIVKEACGTAREFDAVVVTAGAHTKRLLAAVGVELAMKPYRVQAITATGTLDEPICYDATDGFYVRPHQDGILAGNGTEPVEVDPTTADRQADPDFAERLCERIADRFDDLDPEPERAWAGLCTATPDQRPLVGAVSDGFYVATGFQGHGFMQTPAIGNRLSKIVLDGDRIDAYDPKRFDGDESFTIVEGMAVDADDER